MTSPNLTKLIGKHFIFILLSINLMAIFITLKSLLISKIYLIFRVTAKRAGLAIAKQIALAGGSPPDCQVNL